jgi:hypothetical protein
MGEMGEIMDGGWEMVDGDFAKGCFRLKPELLAKPPCCSDKPRLPRPERAYGWRVLLVKTEGCAVDENPDPFLTSPLTLFEDEDEELNPSPISPSPIHHLPSTICNL